MTVDCNEVSAGVSLTIAGVLLFFMGVLTIEFNYAVAWVLVASGVLMTILGIYWVLLVFSEASRLSQETGSGYKLFSSPCSRKISVTSSKGDELYDILWSHPTMDSVTVNVSNINLPS